MAYFPILLDLDGLPCLVAGGGRLGLHKAKLLLEHGADVTVVAPVTDRFIQGNLFVCRTMDQLS